MSRYRLYLHLVWTTRERARLIDAGTAEFLAAHLPRVVLQEEGILLAMGIVQTHVHMLISVKPTTDLPRLIQRLKGGSATLANREIGMMHRVRWAKGYNLETVSPRALSAARTYIENQSAHHPAETIPNWPGFRAFSRIGIDENAASDTRGSASAADSGGVAPA